MIEQMISLAETTSDEVCGLIVNDSLFIPCVNQSSSPSKDFLISANDFIQSEEIGPVTGVFHSHPSGFNRLSAHDRQVQVSLGLDFYLYCDGSVRKYEPRPHLLGRSYEHGITDCYSMFRDAYHLAGWDMPDYGRDNGWWLRGENLYINNLPTQGFYQVSMADVQPGDVIIRQPFDGCDPCHAMIFLPDGRVLHHEMNGFLSRRDNMRPAYVKQTHSVWRHEQWSSLNFQGIYEDFIAKSL